MAENAENKGTNDPNEALGAAGFGILRTLDGVDYHIMPMNKGMRANYAAWIRERHRVECLELEKFYMKEARKLRKQLQLEVEHIDEDEREERVAEIYELEESARKQMADHRKMSTAGEFHYTGEVCQDSLRTHDGVVKHLLLMLQPRHPHLSFDAVTVLLEKHSKDLRDAMREVNAPKKPHSSPASADGSEDQSQK